MDDEKWKSEIASSVKGLRNDVLLQEALNKTAQLAGYAFNDRLEFEVGCFKYELSKRLMAVGFLPSGWSIK